MMKCLYGISINILSVLMLAGERNGAAFQPAVSTSRIFVCVLAQSMYMTKDE